MNTLVELKRQRLERGLSIRKAEIEIGVGRGVLNRAERGETISVAHAKLIADFYDNVKVTDLLPVEERTAA